MKITGKQSTPNFPKNEYFLPLDTPNVQRVQGYIRGAEIYIFFPKIWRYLLLRFALLSYYRRKGVLHNFKILIARSQEQPAKNTSPLPGPYFELKSIFFL